MCGILGISSNKSEKYDIAYHLNRINHRGPDDTGIFISENRNIHLGHVRLSIIDTSVSGHQPMFDDSGRYVMVYNGEIYNFIELKKYLESKYGIINWKSSSDSEVIIQGFAREGSSFFNKLNGIFAILIYDIAEEVLHVMRDPIGVKPLYYTTQNGETYFCSELKGLLGFDKLKRSIRYQSLSDQLLFMYVPEPYTMYDEFFKIERGVHFTYKNGQMVKATKMFSHLHFEEMKCDDLEYIELFQNTFSKAVKRQLVSDVPMSLFLSGGLDSSAVAYESVTQGANIQSAYTISYSNKDLHFDKQSKDLFFAEKVAKQLNLNLNVIEAQPDFLNLLNDLIPYMEDGISDPAAINTYLISKSARKDGVKVMLSGQGADEYLCGYRRYLAEKYIENMPPFYKKICLAANTFIPSNLPGPLNAFTRRLKKLAVALDQEEADRLRGYYMWCSPMQVRKLFINADKINPGIDLESFFAVNKELSNLNKLLAADQEFDLLALNLAYSDKMSMMVGVEARVPFLDFDLVRLMNSMPLSMKLNGVTQKYVLKKSMEGKLSKEIIYRSKAGFALPIRSWFRKSSPMIEKYFNESRIKKQGIFDHNKLNEILKLQFENKSDNSYLIFSILCQQIWLEQQLGF